MGLAARSAASGDLVIGSSDDRKGKTFAAD